MTAKPQLYYAHCLAIYDTPQESRDMETLKELFPAMEVFNPNSVECAEGYRIPACSVRCPMGKSQLESERKLQFSIGSIAQLSRCPAQ